MMELILAVAVSMSILGALLSFCMWRLGVGEDGAPRPTGGHRGGRGRAGTYVIGERVMGWADMGEAEEFRAVAECVERMGWIMESDADYGVFLLTAEGIAEATDY